MTRGEIAVILDIDLGPDIDDAWALAMLLNCLEPDLTHRQWRHPLQLLWTLSHLTHGSSKK